MLFSNTNKWIMRRKRMEECFMLESSNNKSDSISNCGYRTRSTMCFRRIFTSNINISNVIERYLMINGYGYIINKWYEYFWGWNHHQEPWEVFVYRLVWFVNSLYGQTIKTKIVYDHRIVLVLFLWSEFPETIEYGLCWKHRNIGIDHVVQCRCYIECFLYWKYIVEKKPFNPTCNPTFDITIDPALDPTIDATEDK